MIFETPRFRPAGDAFMLVELGNEMSLDVNFRAQGLALAVRQAAVAGVLDAAPCFATVLFHYDSDRIGYDDLQREIARLAETMAAAGPADLPSRLHYIPALYLDPWTRACIEDYAAKIAPRGYDAEGIAATNGLADAADFARVHAATEYWVAAIGSWPGLPFMMALDPRCRLSAPKYNPPRTVTPQGTIGLGGSSTCIYSVESPGGYQIFARTPVPIWSAEGRLRGVGDPMVRLRPGDRVRFLPIDRAEYDWIDEKVEAGAYEGAVVDYQTFSAGKYRTWAKAVAP
ncbi:MAG: carboxyltransferase domain-containing protein [Proteobacteria bacterium]|nr:carboxyltransferase domain-containing protein [Pseudomonadota bacterium]